MSDFIRVEKALIDIDHDWPNHSAVSVLSSTCRFVVSAIPPLLRLGLIDPSECVILGAMTKAELTWAEHAYRFIADAIPPLLASGHISRSAGLWIAGFFLFMLLIAVASSYSRKNASV